MDQTERAALVESIWESWLSGGVETVRDLIRLSVDATLAVDVDEVEVDRMQAMRTTIAEYVGDVSDAAKFIALVELVPGLHPSGAMVGAPCECCWGDPFIVCDACEQHACWAGLFVCEDAITAGTIDRRTLPVKAP